MTLCFRSGKWQPEQTLPELFFAETYFAQAASASVAVENYLASGQSAQNLCDLTPDGCSGPVFAAECLRILLDDCGMRLETVYPYVRPCFGSVLTWEETDAMSFLQPRTLHLIQLLQNLSDSVPAVRHDIRLPEYRAPYGAVEAGAKVRFAFSAPKDAFEQAVLELYGDDLRTEIQMERSETGWETSFQAPDVPAALWYRFRVMKGDSCQWVCPAPDGIHSWLRSSA